MDIDLNLSAGMSACYARSAISKPQSAPITDRSFPSTTMSLPSERRTTVRINDWKITSTASSTLPNNSSTRVRRWQWWSSGLVT